MTSSPAVRPQAPVRTVDVRAYRVPTDGGAESDGTLVWDATTIVVVEIAAADCVGLGYTYADAATATLVRETLTDVVIGSDVFAHARTWACMSAAVRNLGRDGIASMAISAIDIALWDLAAKLCAMPLASLLGRTRDAVPVYGSGGFTSYDTLRLCRQLAGWAEAGIPRVKMKIGRDPQADVERIAAARNAIGERCELFVDANGAYSRKQALAQARRFERYDVAWYEEPVYHQDFEGLAQIRANAPSRADVASGEYGYGLEHFARMLDARAVDVLQADATRCGGFTGLLAVDGLCATRAIPLSTHCAPYVHLHAAAAAKMLRHAEYFFDHVRIERLLFDGAGEPVDGALVPDLSRPGIGLEFRRADARRFEI